MKETSASDPKPLCRSFSYPTGQFAVRIFELVVTAIFLLALWAIRRDRRSFFLA